MQTSKRASHATGLPINKQWASLYLFSEKSRQFEPGTFLKDCALNFFSILDCKQHENIEYINSTTYGWFLTCIRRKYNHEEFIQNYTRRRFQEMSIRNPWITLIHQDMHWQTLVIVNPGQTNCIALLMDSYTDTTSNNFNLINAFTVLLVNAVSRHLNEPQTCNPNILKQCSVPQQPNAFDCGPFSLLNIKHTLKNQHLLFSSTPNELCSSFHSWYDTHKATRYQNYLSWKFTTYMEQHGINTTT